MDGCGLESGMAKEREKRKPGDNKEETQIKGSQKQYNPLEEDVQEVQCEQKGKKEE